MDSSKAALPRKVTEFEAARAAYASAVVRIKSAEEAAKPEVKKLEDALVMAKRAHDACTSEPILQEALASATRATDACQGESDLQAALSAAKKVVDACKSEALLQEALVAAKKADTAAANEGSKVKEMYSSFAEFRDKPSDKAKLGVNALKPQLKLLGVEKKVVDALPGVLAKKRRSQADKKVLSCVEEAVEVWQRSRATILNKSKAKQKQCEEDIAAA